MSSPDLDRALEFLGIDPDLASASEWRPPKRATLQGNRVLWDYVDESGPYGPRAPDPSFVPYYAWREQLPSNSDARAGRVALTEFLGLVESPPDAFAEFVAKWGPLHLCRGHRMPMTHWPFDHRASRRRGIFCASTPGDGTWGAERVEDMRYWARLMLALVSVHAAVSANDLSAASAEDCRMLGMSDGIDDRGDAWTTLNRYLNLLLTLGMVGPAVRLDGEPRYGMRAFGVFGVMVREVVHGVLGERFAVCTSCGELYTPSRLPRAGEDTWCPKPACRKVMQQRAFRKRSRRRSRVGV